LEEARHEYKEIGRPMTFSVHDGKYLSLLSDALNDGGDKQPV